ncbi:MAG: SHOCT domain-containing protein [Bacillota bacterium]
MFIFGILIILGFIYLLNNGELDNLFNRRSGNQFRTDKQNDPVEIIKERYAKGEINKDEYNEMMNNIKY